MPVHKMEVARYLADSGQRIYRIPCDSQRDMLSYVYLILGDHTPILVDCGSGEADSVNEILSGFYKVQGGFHEAIHPKQIARILVTHAHTDHMGGTLQLLQHCNASVFCHPLDWPFMVQFDENATKGNRRFADFLFSTGLTEERTWEIVRAFDITPGKYRSVNRAEYLNDGDHFDGLTIYHTPGHSAGHLCVQVGTSHVILGDLLLAKTLTSVWPELVFPDSGLDKFFESVKKMKRNCPEMTGLPGHGWIVENIGKRCDKAFADHSKCMDRIHQLLDGDANPASISQLVKRMFLTHVGRWSIIPYMNTGAWIETLERQGKVLSVRSNKDMRFYTSIGTE